MILCSFSEMIAAVLKVMYCPLPHDSCAATYSEHVNRQLMKHQLNLV